MINLEELYEFKAKFEHEKLMAEAKISVVEDMIASELATVAVVEAPVDVAEEAVETIA